MSYPTNIRGIALIGNKRSELKLPTMPQAATLVLTWSDYALTKDFTANDAEFLFSQLPDTVEIRFTDTTANLKSPDPGEHVTVQRKNDGLQFKVANHGWSSGWRNSDFRQIAERFFRVTRVLPRHADGVAFAIHPADIK